MDFDFLSESLKEYIEKTSSKLPAPGGGSVVALVASLSCSLLDMVINFTIGKQKYEKYESDFQKIKERNNEIKKEVMRFIEEDSRTYKMIDENKNNKEKQQEYLKKSIEIHKKICEYMKEIIEFSKFAAKYGNKYLISDTGIVALLGISAFKGAKLNILINLKYLSKKVKYVNLMEELNKIEKEIEKNGEEVYHYTSREIGG
ncbi:cyclodeaminase/cyclohydrolase family protein [bacterium]|nr:cyclodeaminase/cyclohydrolase family protein [bacterium]